jgi:hypothetical protein
VTDEKTALDFLFSSRPGLPASSQTDLDAALQRLRKILSVIQESAQADTHQGRVALIGLAERAYWVLIAGIELLGNGNGHAWSVCVRDLCEIFGAVSYLIDKPANALNFLDQGVSTDKLRAAAARRYLLLRHYFRRLLCLALAPPWSLSVEPSTRLTKRPAQHVTSTPAPTLEDVGKGVASLTFLGNMIAVKLTELVTKHPDVIQAGAIIGGK